jgi:hypothetical protein
MSDIYGGRLVIVSTTKAVQGKPQPVPRGHRVYLRPLSTNVGTVNVGTYAQDALGGLGTFVNKTDLEREFSVDDFGKIFIAGAIADGVEMYARPSAPGFVPSSDQTINLSRPDRPGRG